MYIDPQKMRSARERRALTQESLAYQARVNVRTIQRAESGLPIRAETLAEIAAVLGMPPIGLLRPAPEKEPEVAEAESEAEAHSSLKRVTSAEQVVRTLERAMMTVVECSAEPNEATLPVLRKIIGQLEKMLRHPCDPDRAPPLTFPSLIYRLESVAALNVALSDLEREGLALFMGTSSQYVKVPRMQEEGFMATSGRQRPQYVLAARFLVAEYGSERIRVSSDVLWPLEIEDDDLPF